MLWTLARNKLSYLRIYYTCTTFTLSISDVVCLAVNVCEYRFFKYIYLNLAETKHSKVLMIMVTCICYCIV